MIIRVPQDSGSDAYESDLEPEPESLGLESDGEEQVTIFYALLKEKASLVFTSFTNSKILRLSRHLYGLLLVSFY